MQEILFDLTNIRIEISFKSLDELRLILSFCQENNLYKINIPCKKTLKNDFLLNSIKVSKEEFSNIDIIPHFSILHEFKRNRINTLNGLINFLESVKTFGCEEVLLVSGSQKRLTLDSQLALSSLKDNLLFSNRDFHMGVAFNPYLPDSLFEEEIIKLDKKLKHGIVKSIWFQFGNNFKLLESRIDLIKKTVELAEKSYSIRSNIIFFGSILVPSKQFLSRFKYRPWKGVYCSKEFLQSVAFAQNEIINILKTYKKFGINPIIETDVTTDEKLNLLKLILKS